MDRKLNINQQRAATYPSALESAMTKQTSMTKAQLTKLEEFTTKSGKIRYLDSIGLTRGQIAKRLDIRYQHVRNVLITPVKQAREQI